MLSRGIRKYASTLLLRIGNNAMQPISRRITTTSKNLTLLDFEKQKVPKRLVKAFLNLEQLDPNLYRAHELMRGRKSMEAVYGGTVMAPILYQIDRVRNGRSFCTRCVKAMQNGDTIFTAQISFHKRERDSIRHETPPPNVVGPENLKNIQTLMTEATADDTSRIDEVHRRIIQHKFAELLPTLTKDFE
uniref:Acyl-CoA thioesterase-like N-terminal HotDog domain-containing protein n=1 Tax=Parascaris equorum TaxID=6256 RepID=A0A914RES1_PAREQ